MTVKHKTMFQVVVFRLSADERTCAVVCCRTTDAVHDGNSLHHALCSALTAWFRQTKEGRDSYEKSAKDYNVGDLACDLDAKSLRPFLKAEGIAGLEITTYTGDATGWEYDNHLFNSMELEDD